MFPNFRYETIFISQLFRSEQQRVQAAEVCRRTTRRLDLAKVVERRIAKGVKRRCMALRRRCTARKLQCMMVMNII